MESNLQDGFGRTIDYLRMSVTDRCDFRCVYCMAEDMTFLPRQQVLGLEELYRLADLFVRNGVKKSVSRAVSPWCARALWVCVSASPNCRGCVSW